jgi:DNA-directed RNA polymerase subunit beta
VLIGKIRPKPTVDTSSQTYDRFLANIFNNNNKKYKDTSLRVPYGVSGTVCRVQKLSEANGDKIDDDAVEVYKVYIARKLKVQSGDKFAGRYGNKGVCSVVLPQEDMPHMEDGTPIDVVFNSHGVPSRMNLGQIYEANTGMALKRIAIDLLIQSAYEKVDLTDRLGIEESKAEVLNKVVKKYFKELNLTSQQEADKSLGQENLLAQHLSYILSQAGLTIDDLNLKIASPIFTGADIEDVKELMNIAGINPEKTQGKFTLIDGQTGEKFDNPVTVGYTYLLKLNHMIDSKIHARAVGPYTKTTQQPLGGKSKNGGQRVGEMEV